MLFWTSKKNIVSNRRVLKANEKVSHEVAALNRLIKETGLSIKESSDQNRKLIEKIKNLEMRVEFCERVGRIGGSR